jgi:hypothetical protein
VAAAHAALRRRGLSLGDGHWTTCLESVQLSAAAHNAPGPAWQIRRHRLPVIIGGGAGHHCATGGNRKSRLPAPLPISGDFASAQRLVMSVPTGCGGIDKGLVTAIATPTTLPHYRRNKRQ